MQTKTRGNESSAATGHLLVAFELSQRWWKVGFTTGMGHRVRTRRIAAGALESVAEAIADAKKMFGLTAEAKGPRRRPSLVAACHVREVSARVRFAGGFRVWKRWLPRCSHPCRCESHRRPETSFVKPGCEPRLLNVDPRCP